MESQDRIAAVVKLGFTERQARFLVLVMQYSGVCLLRQYSAFAGIVHGQKTRKFFAKLVSRRFATAYCCRHNRGRVYTILLPASAVPGWPADVVLPSDPVWKRDYSGSVRRLIRDGVDTPLASLFVHAARAMPEDGEGAARARSASEAFLFRRLDTLVAGSGNSDQVLSGNSDHLSVALPGQRIVGNSASDEGKDDRHAQATRDSSPAARGAHVERDRHTQRRGREDGATDRRRRPSHQRR